MALKGRVEGHMAPRSPPPRGLTGSLSPKGCDVQGDWGPGPVRGMAHLPGGSVSSEIGEHPGEPVIDLVQGQLPVGGLQDGLWQGRSKGTLSLGR